VTEQVDVIDSKFRFILIAAKRARQLQGGAKPLVHTNSRKPTRIAQEEIRAGVVKWELIPYKNEPPATEESQKKKSKK
jgi:DNA-directed RNA polymerase subunit omega